MLLRSMPDLSAGNTQFRTWFYSRWGRENCLILARTRHAEYDLYRQRLSIKTACGGRERYFVDRRTVAVDDDNYLILNDGQRYGSLIESPREVESFSIFFRSGLLEAVLGSLRADPERIGDNIDRTAPSIEFSERLQPHDTTVTPMMRFICLHLRRGLDDEHWYEEQLQILAERLLIQQQHVANRPLKLRCIKASTRIELCRRLALAADFIESSYDCDIGLAQMADASCLSVHHFMRLFHQAYGVTPMQYLQRKRIAVARRLGKDQSLSSQEIATRVGFNSRATYYRQLARWDERAH